MLSEANAALGQECLAVTRGAEWSAILCHELVAADRLPARPGASEAIVMQFFALPDDHAFLALKRLSTSCAALRILASSTTDPENAAHWKQLGW